MLPPRSAPPWVQTSSPFYDISSQGIEVLGFSSLCFPKALPLLWASSFPRSILQSFAHCCLLLLWRMHLLYSFVGILGEKKEIHEVSLLCLTRSPLHLPEYSCSGCSLAFPKAHFEKQWLHGLLIKMYKERIPQPKKDRRY